MIGMKAKAMPRIIMVFWEHMFHEASSFIFIRPVFFFAYFLLIVLFCRLKDKFSKFWSKGTKCGAT